VTNHDRRVLTAILDHALHGRAASDPLLAAATGLAAEGVTAALTALHETGAIYLRDGIIVAAYPLSFVPTTHRVTIGGVTTYANCAIDALAVPPMAERAADITSACGHCRAPIRVRMRRDRILRSEPAGPVVFYLAKDCCPPGPAVLTRCPHIHFFCDRSHAAQWQEAHPHYRGTVLDLAEAAAFARRHFAEVIHAVRGDHQIA
jgi:alkylmercury lyase-like protein